MRRTAHRVVFPDPIPKPNLRVSLNPDPNFNLQQGLRQGLHGGLLRGLRQHLLRDEIPLLVGI